MSVAEAGVIDMWGIPDWDRSKIELVISDHLGWEPEEEMEHLLMLQEKINAYISFIESGEINTAIPSAAGKTPLSGWLESTRFPSRPRPSSIASPRF